MTVPLVFVCQSLQVPWMKHSCFFLQCTSSINASLSVQRWQVVGERQKDLQAMLTFPMSYFQFFGGNVHFPQSQCLSCHSPQQENYKYETMRNRHFLWWDAVDNQHSGTSAMYFNLCQRSNPLPRGSFSNIGTSYWIQDCFTNKLLRQNTSQCQNYICNYVFSIFDE